MHAISCRLTMVFAGTALLAALATHAFGGTVYKCTAADGSVAYRDKPCEDSTTQREISVPVGHGPSSAAPEPAPQATLDARPMNAGPDAAGAPKDCSNWIPPPRTVEVDPPPPPPDYSAYPKDEQGNTIVVPGGLVNLVVNDKPDAITVANTCSQMITKCWRKNNDPAYSMDACFNSAPRCATSRPWEEAKACCPDSCWQRYADLRRQCVDPLSASSRALFDDHCVPGAAELLDGRTPQ